MVIDAFTRGADGRIDGAWFPTRALPVRGDYLSRLAWQLQTRGGADAFVRVPVGALHAALGDESRVRAALADLGTYTSFSAVLMDEPLPALAALPTPGTAETWEVARYRAAFDAASLPATERRALEAFRVLDAARPGLRLALFDDRLHASGIADVTFVRAAPTRDDIQRVAAAYSRAKPMPKPAARRVGVWFDGSEPPPAAALDDATRAFQVRGGTAVGWCPDDPLANRPDAAAAAPGVSAATFPLRP